jgi:hypothetical protein
LRGPIHLCNTQRFQIINCAFRSEKEANLHTCAPVHYRAWSIFSENMKPACCLTRGP